MKNLLLAILITVMCSNVFAMKAPAYLNVPHFKQCLGKKSMGTWTAWCLPKRKPGSCPASSWNKLAHSHNQHLQLCSSKSNQAHGVHRVVNTHHVWHNQVVKHQYIRSSHH